MTQFRTSDRKHLRISPQLKITKASGLTEPYSEKKLESSITRCGAPTESAQEIIRKIRPIIRPASPTLKIRNFVHTELKRMHPASATRYELSRAVMKLGPTGFPFEKLIGRLYESEGYIVQMNQSRIGRCAKHEIDVIAVRDGKKTFIECKFHYDSGTLSDLKTALYIKGRSDDLSQSSDPEAEHDQFALVTNTRLSSEASNFLSCSGVAWTGWTSSSSRPLADRLEASGLIPLTALSSLPKKMAQELMGGEVITVRDLVDHPKIWKRIAQHASLAKTLQREIEALFEITDSN